jgi:glycerophosphoryl diester phosphodiesterase
MPGLAWLTARPIAHRGLHDAAAGVIENTASAFSAAIAVGYGIETDLQISADGEAMVHHDEALGRLTEGSGRLAAMSAADIQNVSFKATSDRVLTLAELCRLVDGRVPLLLELKSRFDSDVRLVGRVVDVVGGYSGPVGVMSFDPALVETVREKAPGLTRGIVAERHYLGPDWAAVPATAKLSMAFLLHAGRTRPHFVAYAAKDLPAVAPLIARHLFGRPLLTWTVRNKDARATSWADQIIFEGIRPPV